MKRLDKALFDALSTRAQTSARGRSNENLHAGPGDPVQRFLNAMEPGSYVCPHRHTTPPKWEFFVVLSGAAVVLTFDDKGVVLTRAEMNSQGPLRGIELPAGVWHTVAALSSGTVLLELKQGPYAPATDKEFAPWAPREGDPRASRYARWFTEALPGRAFNEPMR